MFYARRNFLKSSSDPAQEISTLTLLLCLFIMLLAFFIVIVSHATYRNDKVQEVLQSIDQTFSGRVFRDNLGPSPMSTPDQGSGTGQELEQLEAMFRARIPGAEIQRIPDRGILSIEMTQDHFNNVLTQPQTSETASPKQDAGLGALLSPSKGQPLQMEIWMYTDKDPASLSAKDRAARLAQLSAWAKKLEDYAVPQGRITIGLQQGDAAKIQLLFRPFVPYAPVAKAGST